MVPVICTVVAHDIDRHARLDLRLTLDLDFAHLRAQADDAARQFDKTWRALSGDGPEGPAAPVSSWFDVSFNVFKPGPGIAQSIAYEMKHSEYDGDSRPAKVPVRSTWLKVAEGSPQLGENTERSDSLVYTLVMDGVLGLFEAVANGEPVTLGIKRWDQRTDAVYTGTPALSGSSSTGV